MWHDISHSHVQRYMQQNPYRLLALSFLGVMFIGTMLLMLPISSAHGQTTALVDAADSGALSPILQFFSSQVGAYSFLVFNLLCAPCFAAIGAINREMGTPKWTLIAVGYQCALAYCAALLVNAVGSALYLGGSWVNVIVVAVVEIAIIIICTKIGKKQASVSTQRAVDLK